MLVMEFVNDLIIIAEEANDVKGVRRTLERQLSLKDSGSAP